MHPPETRRIGVWLSLLAPLLILQPGRGFGAGLYFSGNLERVGDKSVSVRLADRRVIDAMLPDTPPLDAMAIAEQYRFGDQVEIACKPIAEMWEEATSSTNLWKLPRYAFYNGRRRRSYLSCSR